MVSDLCPYCQGSMKHHMTYCPKNKDNSMIQICAECGEKTKCLKCEPEELSSLVNENLEYLNDIAERINLISDALLAIQKNFNLLVDALVK